MRLYTYNHTEEHSFKCYGAFNTAFLNGAYAGSALDGATRYSYSVLGRYETMDPLSEKYYNTSPYVYCAGNLVCRVDYNGNGIKGLGKAKTLAEMFMINGSGSVVKDMLLGGLYGRFLYDLSPDTPEISINPVFDISNKMSQFVMYCIKLISDQK